MSKERRLGLGLDALLGTNTSVTQEVGGDGAVELTRVHPNPYQPRKSFDDDETRSLAESIRRSGLLQPLIVRRSNGHFELVAGERRLRAARLAGLSQVAVVVREFDDREMLEVALVENLQRRDLNAIEKARAFKQLMEMNAWSQDEVAQAVGLCRSSIANFLRLLDLPSEIQEGVSRGTISMGHARALLATGNAALQKRIFQRILADDLSVRTVERMLSRAKPASVPSATSPSRDPYVEDLERRLTDFFGSRVKVETKKRGGRISVEWYTNEQLTGILSRLSL